MKRSPDSVAFGAFELSPSARTLRKNGIPVALGDRALDVLIVLVERAGEIVPHKELIARVWRDLIVEPGNLRVHMRALRKALGDGEDGAGYIENVTGQGYCFVAPVTRAAALPAAPPATTTPSLPAALARMIGRDEVVQTLVEDLRNDRFVTLVGPGGMGKTTVAIAVAHRMVAELAGRVYFVDLGATSDPLLVPATVASTLGLPIQSADPLVSLIAFLQQTRMLLVLDNCEHLIDAAATLAETIFNQAPQVLILTTSREALRTEGEHAFRLRPLDAPAPDASLSAATALAYPAVRLFVERATAADRTFALTDSNANVVADICGRLDGIALALEVVAGRAGTYGLEGMADLLRKQLSLHWQGRRTALPRHQTLQALLDWSYGLLPPSEQRLLRMLAILVGPFTLDAAQAIASPSDFDAAQLAAALDALLAKSLISVAGTQSDGPRYRLLETTRLYASRKLEDSGEAAATAERHARYFIHLLSSNVATREGAPRRYEYLGNLRAALEWCFSGAGIARDVTLGIDLAAVSAPVFLDLSLWTECRKWSAAALAHLSEATRGGRCELALQAALAIASLLMNESDARMAIARGLEIAESLDETAIRFRLLGALHVYQLRMTDFRGGLAVAEKMEAVARTSQDVTLQVIADWMLGSSHYVLGNPASSLRLFESGFIRGGAREAGKDQQLAGLYYRTRALYGLARVQWLCGYPDRALRSARQAVAEAAESASPVNVSYSLVYCCYVFLWCGDLDTAQDMLDKVMAQPHWQGRLVWFHAEALALKGELLIQRGAIEEGIELLRRVLADMQASRQKNLMQTVTACALAEGLVRAGRADEALTIIDEAISHSPGGTETWDGPELLRVSACVLLSMTPPNLVQAEQAVLQSLECAQRQGALGWEARATLTLLRLRTLQGRAPEGRSALASVFARFTEGFDTRDLQEAARILRC